MDSEAAESYTISSTPVRYPHKAYPSQIGMIDRVIKSLQRNQNCLIESPTGSGKSLALLCSVLAWRKNEYERVEKDILEMVQAENTIKNSAYGGPSPPKNGTEDKSVVDLTLDSDDSFSVYDDGARFIDPSEIRVPISPKKPNTSSEKCPSKPLTEDEIRERIYEARKKIPKIYFGTRTHKQLAQLIRELKKTNYADVKMTILASRDQTCINEKVRAERDRSEACRKMLNPSTNMLTGTCQYHARWKKNFQKPALLRGTIRREQQSKRQNEDCGAWDIEDLVEIGREFGFCPYFAASNSLLSDAELVFCPYNYLIDPLVRNSVRLDLKEQIIVLDEAHNIEDVCRDASSFMFTRFELDDATENFHCAAELDKFPPAKSALFLEKVCSRLVKWLDEVVASKTMKIQSHSMQSVLTQEWQGQQFIDILVQLELEQKDGTKIKEHLEAINAYNDEENSEKPRRSPEDLEASIISPVALKAMEKLVLFLDYFWREGFDPCDYRVCVRQEQQMLGTQRTQYYHATQGGAPQNSVTLNLWCMNPAMAFGDIGSVAKSVILASGTLAPMKTFETELGVPFKLQLEATHVLPKDRMFVASVAKGPSGRPLRVTYQNTSEWVFQDEIGQLVIDVCASVPYGVLCFFPSYKLLETLQERWRSTGTWDRLSTRKLIVVEPKMGEELQRTMERFYQAVENPSMYGLHCTGALFLAVCRGKVSEGLDFADNNARAVITIGIPYPNFSGFEVMQKRDYNNDRVRQGKSTLTGDQWYEIQAYRALNQALGRCLRHRQDWGALILVDERFGKDPKRYCGNLSRWIRENIRHYDDFGKARSDLEQFTERLLATQENGKNRFPLQSKRLPSSSAGTPSASPSSAGPYAVSPPSSLSPCTPSSYPLAMPSSLPHILPAVMPRLVRQSSTLSTPVSSAQTALASFSQTTPLVQPRKSAFAFRRNGQSGASSSPYFEECNEEQATSASSRSARTCNKFSLNTHLSIIPVQNSNN